MIPLKDNIPSRTVPLVNYTIIALTALAFLAQLREAGQPNPVLVERYGMIPRRVLSPVRKSSSAKSWHWTDYRWPWNAPLRRRPFNPWLTLVSCIFLHGGWMHFLGNMWFLLIFGDNVEDRIGHFGYVLFYLFCGTAASAAHLVSSPGSEIPTIGASGAIAGVMGAYFLLYPRAMVLSVVPLFFFLQMIVLPAPVFLGIWFVIQFFQGAASITSTQADGVAGGPHRWFRRRLPDCRLPALHGRNQSARRTHPAGIPIMSAPTATTGIEEALAVSSEVVRSEIGSNGR